MGRLPLHGLSNTPTYRSWAGMKRRCKHRPDYAGRGISICEDWKDSFAIFLQDMGLRPSREYTLDRIDNYGNYEPGNCRWATKIEQGSNKRSNRHVLYRDVKMTIAEAWRLSGKIIPKSTLKSRMYGGWPIDQALETPAIMGRNQWTENHA